MFSLVVTLVVLALMLLGVGFGLLRGLNRSLVRFGAVVITAFIAFGVANVAYPAIAAMPTSMFGITADMVGAEMANPSFNDLLNHLLLSNDMIAELVALSPTLADFILMIPRALVTEILFIAFFFIIKFFLGFVQIFFNKVGFMKSKAHRGFAAAVGGLQGIFCACILLLPVLGIMPITDQVVASANEHPTYDELGNKTGISLYVDELNDNFCAPTHNDPTYKVLDAIGVRSLCTKVFYSLSSVTDENGNRVSFFQEIEDATPAVFDVVQLSGISFDNLTEQDMALIRSTIGSIQNSNLLSGVVSDVLINGSEVLSSGGSILGISIPSDLDKNTSAFFNDVLSSISKSKSDELINDLPNVVDAVSAITQSGIMDDGASLTDILADKDNTVDILSSLANSSTLSPATISAVNNFGIAALGEALALTPEEIDEMFIKEPDLFNNMTPEEREAEVEKLAETLSAGAEVLDKLSNSEEDTDLIDLLPQAGKLLDNMSDSALLGDATKGVINGLLNTDAAKDLITEDAKETILDKIENGEINYEATLGGIGAAHNLSQSITVGGNNAASGDEMASAVEQLFTALDETTAEILKATLNDVLLENMGVPEEAADMAVIVFDALLDEIVKFQPTENTDYEKEAAAIEATLNFVTGIMEDSSAAVSEETLYDLLDTALESETITNTIISASELLDLSYQFDEETLSEIAEIINGYENTDIDEDTVAACATALRAIFGIAA